MSVVAICLSMTVIVVSSVLLGTALPILFHLVKIDPAHSSMSIVHVLPRALLWKTNAD